MKCKVERCENEQRYKSGICEGLCNKHSFQTRKYGRILERTRFDPNEFIFEGKICKIKLYDRYGNEKAEAIIDAEDYGKVKDYKWYVNNFNQVMSDTFRKSDLLHRIIMAPDDNQEVDHIYHNRLDNRKEKLRICSSSQNHMNRRLQSNSTSGYTGVSFHKASNKYRAYIKKEGKTTSLGCYETSLEAAEAYDKAALEIHGEFALLNL